MRIRILATLGLLAVAVTALADGGWELDVEAAMVQSGRNDVRIPGDSGTEFSLTDDLSTDEDVAFRARIGRRFGQRHHVSVLVAPLRLYADGSLDREVRFNGETFAAGTDLESVYKFDSYRATWRYDLVRRDNLDLGLGLTVKVRDAFIELSSDGTTTRKDNLGVVPLAHLRLDWRWGRTLGLLLEADAAAAPQGRAVDALAALVIRPEAPSSFYLGYRILEGGADVDEVYNFALVHYYTFGWRQRF